MKMANASGLCAPTVGPTSLRRRFYRCIGGIYRSGVWLSEPSAKRLIFSSVVEGGYAERISPSVSRHGSSVCKGCKLVGCGSAVPSLKISNDDLAKIVDTSDEWISVRTGIRYRRVLSGKSFEMKALRALRSLSAALALAKPQRNNHFNSTIWKRFYGAQPQQEDGHQAITSISFSEDDVDGFDSSHFEMDANHLTSGFEAEKIKTWNEKYRERVKSKVFGEETKTSTILDKESEKRKRAAVLARALLEASVEYKESEDEEEEIVVREEDQKSLSVGIIGAPNAGKSALTNYMVGTKVAAVSRKTNTTTHEVIGVMTKGDTQICFFDTPGLMLKKSGFPYNDMKVRNESAWGSVSVYDVLIVIFDVHRHLTRPDSRVVRLIHRMGSQLNTTQRRILCMNKVDLVEKKKDLLKVAEEFKDLPGYERHFMISGLKGWGVRDLGQYLMEQAVKRPWDEDPFTMSEEVMKNISLEVVREKLLEYIHQEIPYNIEHRLMDWKELRDGSLRIEQHFITHKMSQRKILVGKKGSKIGRIGIEANEELRAIFKRNVHLILMVRVK